MSGVELRVVLVGDDPEQQEAFNNEVRRQTDTAEREDRHTYEPDREAQPTVPPIDSARVAPADEVPQPPAPVAPTEAIDPNRPLITSIEQLIEHIDQLVRVRVSANGGRENRLSQGHHSNLQD